MLRDKLKDWIMNNIFHVKNKAISELLKILISEGHTELPKTAETLLQTKKFSNKPRIMKTARGNNGLFMYFGLEEVLSKMLSSNIYVEKKIRILVNIDGVPIYKNSSQQFWPILIEIFHEDYICNPGIVAIYWGDSKPNDVDEYMEQFIQEANKLTENGFKTDLKTYEFKILAFVPDTPARSYLKCSKGHGGYYSCERCTTKGVSINKRRIFPEMDCELRDKNSFKAQKQKEHHTGTSPLLKLKGFDPVRQVFLDGMHLFFLGIIKYILLKLTKPKSKSKLRRTQTEELDKLLLKLSQGIPLEFQRKTFKLKDVSFWKANQFKFIMCYGGPLLLKKYLSTQKYKHLLLLLVSLRILYSKELAVKNAEYARTLLRLFFQLMPNMYGKDSQSNNFHNAIHVVDDVLYAKTSLTYISAFPFENCLGQIKRLVRTPNNPLVQVGRRLHEIQMSSSSSSLFIQKRYRFSEVLKKTSDKADARVLNEETDCDLLQIKFKDATIRCLKPDNIVRISDGTYVEIEQLRYFKKKLIFKGYTVKVDNAFTYPCDSSIVGIVLVLKNSTKLRTFECEDITHKCLKLTIDSKKFIFTMLHC